MTEIDVRRKLIERVNNIDLAKIQKNDRKPIRHILKIVETFDITEPMLEYGFDVIDNHCYVSIRGLNEEFSVRTIFNTFLSKEHRDSTCDAIKDVFLTPSPSSGRGPVVKIQVDRMSWNDIKTQDNRKKRNEYPITKSQNQNIVFANEIDLPEIDRDDRKPVHKILKNIMTFYETMPELNYEFIPKEYHYNIIVRGWNEEFSAKKMYNMFLSKNKDVSCVPVMDVTLNPKPDSGRGPIMKIQVNRTSWNKSKSKSKSKSIKKKKKKNKK